MCIRDREWPYKNVPRRIIGEEYLSELGSNDILDYKMYCFHGEPKLTVVCSNRFSKTGTRMNFYDIDWNPMGIHFGHYPPLPTEFPKPDAYGEMQQVAMELSKGCPFLRVDFYETKGHIFIEMCIRDSFDTCQTDIDVINVLQDIIPTYDPNHNV